jgi:hypothetical protein
MATTPEYGWPTPNDSDYVKNGAEAMRNLGDAIDSTVYANALIVEAMISPFLLMGA